MILQPNDLRAVRPIAENINDPVRLEPYIKEAEALRLVDVLGAALYRWLDEADFSGEGPFTYAREDGVEIEVTKAQADAIFDGGYWEGPCGGKTFRTEGLRPAVAYIAYSRFLLNNPVNPTAFGVRYKDGEFSTKVEDSIVARASAEAAKIGEAYLAKALAHLGGLGLLPPCRIAPPAANRDFVMHEPKM